MTPYLRAAFLVSLAITLASGAAWAQAADPAPDPAPEAPPGIEEIVITAERRESTVQDTPIAVTAFGNEMLDDIGMSSPAEIANFTPGMSFNAGTYSPRINIRGIGNLANEIGGNTGVAIYNDGIYNSNPAAAGGAPTTTERIEVLRGPQGTLYGRNAMGGAVNIISKRPTAEFEGEFRFTYGSFDYFGESLELSGPVPGTDTLRYRLMVAKADADGWVENESGPDIGETDNLYYEAQLEWDVTEDLMVWLKYNHFEYDQNSAPTWPGLYLSPYDMNSGTYGSLNRNPWLGWGTPNPTADDPWKVDYDYEGFIRLDDNHQITGHVVWDLGDMRLTYIGGYAEYKWSTRSDWDASSNPAAQYEVSIGQDQEWWSSELQLASTTDDPLQWIMGLYYYEESFNQPFTQHDPTNERVLNPFESFSFPVSTLGSNPDAIIYHQRGIMDADAWAVYGQLDYDYSEEWHFSVGLRYSKDEKEGWEHNEWVFDDYTGAVAGFICDFGAGVFTSPCAYPTDNGEVTQKDDWDAITWRVEADYSFSDDQMLYGSVSTGYKAGGFKLGNVFSNLAPGEPEDQVDEEEVIAYEIGWKATLMDQLRLNAAVYYYDYSDFQVPVSVFASGIRHSIFQNAKEAESYGFELETLWQANENLTVIGGYSFQQTEIKDMGKKENGEDIIDETDPLCDRTAVPPALTCGAGYPLVARAEGNDLIQAPEHKISLTGLYEVETSFGELLFSATWIYTDEQNYSIFADDDRTADSWNRVDARASWTSAEGTYRVIASVKNLTNEEIILGLDRTDAIHSNMQIGGPDLPRRFSIELHYRF